MSDDPVFALADRYFAAIEAGDLDAVRGCMTEDAIAWSNFGGENGIENTMKILGWLHRRASGLRYEIVRREGINGGFLQEHVLRATAPDGTDISMPACLVVTVDDGKIARINEYLDPSHVAALSHR